MVAYLSKSDANAGFDQVMDFLNAHVIHAKRTAWNEFSYSMASAVICLATGRKFNFSKVGKGFLGVETPLFTIMLVQPKPPAAEEEDEVEVPNAPTPPSLTIAPSPPLQDPIPTPPQAQPATPLILKLKKRVKKLEKKRRSKSSGLKRLRKVVDMDAELQGRITDVSTATKEVNATEPTVFDDEKVTMTMAQTLIKMKAKKARLFDEQIAKRLHNEEEIPKSQEETNLHSLSQKEHDNIFEEYGWLDKDVEEPQKKKVAEETLLQESFKKLKVVEVSGSHYIQDTPTNDPKEISEEDVKNMIEIIPVSEFKVEALQVKYPLIHWEIHSEGSRYFWKIIRVGGITETSQSFEDMLKGFDREDLVAL
uniref:Uncharacterized protein n=1 Tax=Tanacetum cinerariifolium TaxID=118510 RepID=A0A6L2MQK6_TANCI|nr:hypothetical protein [Tanacetum cinerariifolium]